MTSKSKAGTERQAGAFSVDPDRLRRLLDEYDGEIARVAEHYGIARLSIYEAARRHGIEIGGLRYKLARALPEDLGLPPLGCGECGTDEIGGHPCPKCGYDPSGKGGTADD